MEIHSRETTQRHVSTPPETSPIPIPDERQVRGSHFVDLSPLKESPAFARLWFGNTLAGYIGAFTENMGQYPWMVSLAGDFDVRPEHAGLLGVFGGLAVVLLAFSIALWAISGRIVVWMHGAEKATK